MKRDCLYPDFYIPSETEIHKAIQHYNRLNNARPNFYAGRRVCWWYLYWLPYEGHFVWSTQRNLYLVPTGIMLCPSESPHMNRQRILVLTH